MYKCYNIKQTLRCKITLVNYKTELTYQNKFDLFAYITQRLLTPKSGRIQIHISPIYI